MQLVSYRVQGHMDGSWRAGVEHEGLVVDVTALWHDGDHETTTRQLLAAGPVTVREVFKQVREALDAGPDAPGVFQATDVELGPPVPDPDKIICIGINYADHSNETGIAQSEVPLFFAKFRNSLTGPTSPILLPRVSNQIDYEGELAVIIGTRCKEISEQEALQYVAGYSIWKGGTTRQHCQHDLFGGGSDRLPQFPHDAGARGYHRDGYAIRGRIQTHSTPLFTRWGCRGSRN